MTGGSDGSILFSGNGCCDDVYSINRSLVFV